MPSFVQCTIKKSISVTKHLLKYGIATIGIASLIAVFAYLIWLIRDMLVATWNIYVNWNAFWWSLIETIPWFAWIIIAIPLGIVVYSAMWCYKNRHPGKIADILYLYNMEIAIGISGFLIGGLIWASLFKYFCIELSVCGFITASIFGGIISFILSYWLLNNF